MKINDVEVLRFWQFIIVQTGKAAVWSAGGNYGVRNITVHYPTPLELYSRPGSYGQPGGIYDPRDFGMRDEAPVTGSITGGTNTLVLAEDVGFKKLDYIIIAIGGEAGGGDTGTNGVGGSFPIPLRRGRRMHL